jgi:hypothetical protein
MTLVTEKEVVKPNPPPTEPKPAPIIKEGQLVNRKSKAVDNTCLGVEAVKAGARLMLKDCSTAGDDVW